MIGHQKSFGRHILQNINNCQFFFNTDSKSCHTWHRGAEICSHIKLGAQLSSNLNYLFVLGFHTRWCQGHLSFYRSQSLTEISVQFLLGMRLNKNDLHYYCTVYVCALANFSTKQNCHMDAVGMNLIQPKHFNRKFVVKKACILILEKKNYIIKLSKKILIFSILGLHQLNQIPIFSKCIFNNPNRFESCFASSSHLSFEKSQVRASKYTL